MHECIFSLNRVNLDFRTLRAFEAEGRVLTTDEIEHCIKQRYKDTYDVAIGHAQASALKSMVLPS